MSEETKVSKAQQKAVAKYMKNNYDEIKIRVEKGHRDVIKAAATVGSRGKCKRIYQKSSRSENGA